MDMNRIHYRRRIVRPCDGEDCGVLVPDQLLLHPKAPGDDHLAVLRERLANRAERFLDRGVDEAAGVDDDEVGACVGLRGFVALGTQLRQDALGINERLRTP
jgi:hypothetical protein